MSARGFCRAGCGRAAARASSYCGMPQCVPLGSPGRRTTGVPAPRDPPEQLGLLDTPAATPSAPLGSTTLPRARATDRATSHRAAHGAARGLTTKQRAVLLCFERFGPLYDEALVDVYSAERLAQLARGFGEIWPDMPDSSLRTRRSELVTLQRLRDSGRLAHTKRGGETTVWEVVPGTPGANDHAGQQ